MFSLLVLPGWRVVEQDQKGKVNSLEAYHNIVADAPVARLLDDDPTDQRHNLRYDGSSVEQPNGNMTIFARHDLLDSTKGHLQEAGTAAKQSTAGYHLVDALSGC